MYTSVYIESDDTVTSIAQEILDASPATAEAVTLNMEIDEIVRINKLGNPDKIIYGDHLIVTYLEYKE